ncbi:MAG TPA: ABC transporter ATP-binding protein [Nevskiaceae bacterium]|nr:ABC transporter ATP-binding protein [Nevskiaceae bacterium]
MSLPVVAENVGKEYILGQQASRTATFVEALSGALREPLQRLKRLRGEVDPSQRFWAIKDASFEVREGDVLGIIGRNGAGKSTLLKILSRITLPTEGRVRLRGRVGSLLEVGTGFHPELTGRENVFLNGAILGMTQREIKARFDEIVEYSGVEKFLDTPVKHYSSGMKVRLGFSVAAHFEPEILIIDEVLAVGDAAFQKKCLGKMQDVAQGGRTVLFVSHSMNAVAQLTRRCLLLDGGRIAFDGPTDQAIQHYIGTKVAHMWNGRMPTKDIACDARFRGNFPAWMTELGLGVGQGEEVPMGGAFKLEVAIEAHAACEGLRFAWTVNTPAGQPALTGISKPFDVPAGKSVCEVQIDHVNLVPGEYDMSLHFGTGGLAEARSEWDCLVGFGHLAITERDAGRTVFAGHWDRRFGPTIHEHVRVRLTAANVSTKKEGELT